MGLYYDKFTVRRFLYFLSVRCIQYVDESSLRPSDRIGNEGVLYARNSS